MRVIGLTGGIATGKSTVARILRDVRNISVIDADQVARQVVTPGEPVLAKIVEAFGPDILDDTGALDRARMRARIAHDASARQTLNALTHPAILASIQAQLTRLADNGIPVAIVEAALMIETGSWRQYDAVIVVSCRSDVQLSRLMERDRLDPDTARALIAAQWPMADKEAVASHVIYNNGDHAQLLAAVERAWKAVT